MFSFHAGIVQMSPRTDTNMPNALVKVSTHNLKLNLISDSWPVLQPLIHTHTHTQQTTVRLITPMIPQ